MIRKHFTAIFLCTLILFLVIYSSLISPSPSFPLIRGSGYIRSHSYCGRFAAVLLSFLHSEGKKYMLDMAHFHKQLARIQNTYKQLNDYFHYIYIPNKPFLRTAFLFFYIYFHFNSSSFLCSLRSFSIKNLKYSLMFIR